MKRGLFSQLLYFVKKNNMNAWPVYQKALDALKSEISQYPSDNALWVTSGSTSNSAGNLCLHLIGNLNHFVGAVLGKTGYVRNREAEFNDKDMSREWLMKRIEETYAMMEKVLGSLTEKDLESEFPSEIAGKANTGFYLLFFYGHFQYHLGQINYHRRMLN